MASGYDLFCWISLIISLDPSNNLNITRNQINSNKTFLFQRVSQSEKLLLSADSLGWCFHCTRLFSNIPPRYRFVAKIKNWKIKRLPGKSNQCAVNEYNIYGMLCLGDQNWMLVFSKIFSECHRVRESEITVKYLHRVGRPKLDACFLPNFLWMLLSRRKCFWMIPGTL